MTEPLSSNEIEDVVSSVRRLVSTDQRPKPLTRDLGPDKLLLTPSLRVVSDNPAPVSYTHLRAHETVLDLVCRLLLEKKTNSRHRVIYTLDY